VGIERARTVDSFHRQDLREPRQSAVSPVSGTNVVLPGRDDGGDAMSERHDEHDERYDVVVVGGGAAGLSGALALARARRSVLVIDDGEPRNAAAGHVHNYLTRDGTAPSDLSAAGRDEVMRYGGHIVSGRVESADRDAEGFVTTLADRRTIRSRRLLVATGLVDELPDIDLSDSNRPDGNWPDSDRPDMNRPDSSRPDPAGLRARWGRDVLHCPYCHGWEIRDRRIGVLATSPLAVAQAELWRQWSPDVTLLSHHEAPPDGPAAERLAARGITIVAEPVVAVEIVDDVLTGVRLATGEIVELDAVAVAPRMTARSAVLESLGISPVEVEMGGQVIGTQIPVDPTGATSVGGVWASGNVADVRAHVISSAAAGLVAAAAINADLVEADTAAALASYRETRRTMFDEAAWEARYRERPAIWSGRPNPQLVAEVDGRPAGRALDVGCGEGADAVWLAERGWRVSAVDISTTALERAAAHAEGAGTEVAARIDWQHVDLREWPPPQDAYDLVSAQFMQLPSDLRRAVFARLAAAVAPGGLLLIVGHDPSDLRTTVHRGHFPDMMFTAGSIAAELDPRQWDVRVAEARPRAATDPQGRAITIRDAVMAAVRRSTSRDASGSA
jgi:thioredoxin reductase/SAM-dependent methyltransferase